MRSRVLGERSVSVRARLAAAPDPPLSTESDIFIPSYMGLISVIRVHKAAMAIMPAPISLTLETQTSVAYDAIDTPSGIGAAAVSQGTATPQDRKTPNSMARPPTIPTR